jgi:hypothetical protein
MKIKNSWSLYWDAAYYMCVVFFIAWAVLGIRHAQKTPSSPWEAQPTAELFLCGERMRPGEAARRAETEGSQFVPILTPGDPENPGPYCHYTRVWWTPGGKWGEVQSEWGQPANIPPELLKEFRRSGWFRHWWDFPWDGEWN